MKEAKPSMAGKCPQCGAALPAGTLAGLCPACLLQQGVADTAGGPGARSFEAPSTAELAKLFPQLEIQAFLGKGGMGAVYQARQPALQRVVALKILPVQDAGEPDFAERFTREARALARLSHPNIVGVHEFGQVNGFHYFLMEYVDGVNLRQLEKTRRLSPREALQIVPQLCDALQYAHDEGVVHRDIKPENILIDRKGRVKIADFGLAKIVGRDTADLRLTQEGQVMGTPHYMAPEQFEQPLEVDHRADIFSLGVVFYEMLTGELPLGKFAPPSRKVQVDVRLDEVVLQTLEKEPNRRYQRAEQVKTAGETITADRAGTGRTAAGRVMVPVPAWQLGVEYKSKMTLFGLPLVHVATGMDVGTGKRRIARGIIAIGNVAIGGVAIGGAAIGVVALGGGSVGLLAFGGGALGILAFGGLAIGLAAALGGGAIAPLAIGGGAVGYFAYGGGAYGHHAYSGVGIDPKAWDFFEPWVEPLLEHAFTTGMLLAGFIVLLVGLIQFVLMKKARVQVGKAVMWGQFAVTVVCALFCWWPLWPVLGGKPLLKMPKLYLVTGFVTDRETAQPLSNVRVGVGRMGALPDEFQSAYTDGNGQYVLVTQLDASRPRQTSNIPTATNTTGREIIFAWIDGYEGTMQSLDTNGFGLKRRQDMNLQLRRHRTPQNP